MENFTVSPSLNNRGNSMAILSTFQIHHKSLSTLDNIKMID